jgi:hypothetical protein
MAHGSEFRVQGSGCRVQDSRFRVDSSGLRVQGSRSPRVLRRAFAHAAAVVLEEGEEAVQREARSVHPACTVVAYAYHGHVAARRTGPPIGHGGRRGLWL